ncbi:hypothetical protein TRICI_000234 [Trichomonascus ciferrii]|uniref:HRDC domain-containing protein n=1 Tax=Trichomonascus ciferrii TaxID=44093 RepID=A0A642VE31_9ASCO|nr:hypothetical protein TRICI_000234 [Trichomonascus ciferrii]
MNTGMSNFDEKSKPVFGSLVSTIRTASQLAAQDISFYKTLDRDLSQSVEKCSDRLLQLINRMVQTTIDHGEELEEFNDLDELQEHWKAVGGVLDGLFEKTDIALDELKRQKGSAHKIEVNAKEENGDLKSLGQRNERVVMHSKDLDKPQEKFKRKVNNSADVPFKPLLTSKPHALESLEESMQMVQGDHEDSTAMERDDVGDEDEGPKKIDRPHYKQPYKHEIENQEYPPMKVTEPIPYKDWDENPVIYVDNQEKLNAMIKDLQKSKEIAVDLEHHDYRSFQGIVCLMQISNREKDWIVDTLDLRDELEALNVVFADPKIVKVLHGAFMDIIWLQRDFGLYIVSLFDTYCASKALNLKKHSLAYLLENYAKFQTSKEYQRADWRVRPIPERMLGYARADTHFLLYIYDILRNNLLEKQKMEKVLADSRDVAKQRYETPGYTDKKSGIKSSLAKYAFTPGQKVVYESLYDWRDSVARQHDESVRYVMPNHFMANLCYTMPDTVTGVLGSSNGLTAHIRSGAKDIAKVIEQAKKKIESMGELLEPDVKENTNVDEDDDESWFERIEANYAAYEREFTRAFNRQQDLFNTKRMKKAYGRLFKEKAVFFEGTLDEQFSDQDVDMDVSPDSLTARKELIRNKLNLYVPLPPVTAEPYVEAEEVPNDFESIANQRFIPSTDNTQPEYEEEESSKEDTDKNTREPSPRADEIVLPEGPHNPNKRKSEEFDDIDEMDAAMLTSKERRKAKRRKLRLMKQEEIAKMKEVTQEDAGKHQPSTNNDQQQSEPFVEAFDYSNASSVLENPNNKHEKKANKKDKKNNKDKPSFDPYAANENAPKGARKKAKKNAGVKSLTFKKKK